MASLNLDFFETIIVYKSLTDDTYLASIIDHLKPIYFKNKDIKNIFEVIIEFYNSRGTKPTLTEIKAKLDTEDLKSSFKNVVNTFTGLDKTFNNDELVHNTETFIKEKAVYHTMLEVVEYINKNNVDTSKVLSQFEKACSISLATDTGLDFLENLDLFVEDLKKQESYIPTKWKWLDSKINGGLLENGRALYVFAGETNIGKSIFLGNIACNIASQGKTVLLVSLEMPEMIYAKRLATNITKIPFTHLQSDINTLYQSLLNYKNDHNNARIIIKEFPPSTITCNNLRAFIKKIISKGVKIDALVVDYINLLHSTIGNSIYERIKVVTEQLRALSYVFNIPIVSATQLNREGYEISNPGLKTLSESMGTGHTADVILSVWQEDTDKELGIINMGMMKNRFGPNFGSCKMRIDYSTLTIKEDEISNETESAISSVSLLNNLSVS